MDSKFNLFLVDLVLGFFCCCCYYKTKKIGKESTFPIWETPPRVAPASAEHSLSPHHVRARVWAHNLGLTSQVLLPGAFDLWRATQTQGEQRSYALVKAAGRPEGQQAPPAAPRLHLPGA